jgi:hypothetical protein
MILKSAVGSHYRAQRHQTRGTKTHKEITYEPEPNHLQGELKLQFRFSLCSCFCVFLRLFVAIPSAELSMIAVVFWSFGNDAILHGLGA